MCWALTRSEPQQQRADPAAPAAVRDREAHRDHRRADVAHNHQPHHATVLCDQPEIALLHNIEVRLERLRVYMDDERAGSSGTEFANILVCLG